MTAPRPDYEGAARAAGWKTADLTPGMIIKETPINAARNPDDPSAAAVIAWSWEEACSIDDLDADSDPYLDDD